MKFKENDSTIEEPKTEEKVEVSIKDEIETIKKIINTRVLLIQDSIEIIKRNLETIDRLCNEIHD